MRSDWPERLEWYPFPDPQITLPCNFYFLYFLCFPQIFHNNNLFVDNDDENDDDGDRETIRFS